MKIFEVFAVGVLIVLFSLLFVFIRRELISRAGGTIEMNMRLSTFAPERGWAPGLARFVGDELRWYRLFSFGFRPRRVFARSSLSIIVRRPPEGAERLSMPGGWIVVRCATDDQSVELALAEPALSGLLAWLESAPPAHPYS